MRRSIILGCLLVLACSSQDSRMARLEERFSAVEKQLAGIDKQLAIQNERFATADKRFDRHEERLLIGEKQLGSYKDRLVAGEKNPPSGDNKSRAASNNRRSSTKKPRVVVETSPEPSPVQKESSPETDVTAHSLPPLDRETALQILKKQPTLVTAQCRWKTEITRIDSKTSSIPYSKSAMKCVNALEKMGLLQVGKCVDWGYDKSCRALSIKPVNGTRIADDGPQGVFFDCATSSIDSIVSLDDFSYKTRVKYERTDTANTTLTSKLTACPLEIPQQNKNMNQCYILRNLEGDWVYEP